MRRSGGRGAALVTIALTALACGGSTPSPTPPSAPSMTPDPTAPTVVPTPSTVASSATPSVAVDGALLEILPADIDGVVRRADAETAAEIAASADLASSVDGIAVAIFVGPLATDTAGDYAVATVARLRDGVFDEAWFRDWRDSFDAGVCEQAGGVQPGRSEVEIAGRTVHRSTCAGDVVIHHVHLADGAGADVVVSVQGAGPADLGRRIMASVKE